MRQLSARALTRGKPKVRGQAPPDHGRYIYAYCHTRTKQVLYSLHRHLQGAHALKQLPDAGANNNPTKLRKDLWQALWTVELPSTSAGRAKGLELWQRLREWRKLHETSWTPPQFFNRLYTPAEMEEMQKRLDQRGGSKKETVHSLIKREKRRLRARIVMDQKANSVADLAAAMQVQAGMAEQETLRYEEAEWRKQTPGLIELADQMSLDSWSKSSGSIREREAVFEADAQRLQAIADERAMREEQALHDKQERQEERAMQEERAKREEQARRKERGMQMRKVQDELAMRKKRAMQDGQAMQDEQGMQDEQALKKESALLEEEAIQDKQARYAMPQEVDLEDKQARREKRVKRRERAEERAMQEEQAMQEERGLQEKQNRLAKRLARDRQPLIRALFAAIAVARCDPDRLAALRERMSKEWIDTQLTAPTAATAQTQTGLETPSTLTVSTLDELAPHEYTTHALSRMLANSLKLEETSEDRESQQLPAGSLPERLVAELMGFNVPEFLMPPQPPRDDLFTGDGVRIMWKNPLDAEFAKTWPAKVEHTAMGLSRHEAPDPKRKPMFEVPAPQDQSKRQQPERQGRRVISRQLRARRQKTAAASLVFPWTYILPRNAVATQVRTMLASDGSDGRLQGLLKRMQVSKKEDVKGRHAKGRHVKGRQVKAMPAKVKLNKVAE